MPVIRLLQRNARYYGCCRSIESRQITGWEGESAELVGHHVVSAKEHIEHARTDAPAPETIQRVVRGWFGAFLYIFLSIYRSITVHSKYTGTGKQQAKLDRNALRTARVAIQRALPPPRRRTTRELVRHARVELAVHRREGDRRGDCYGGDWRS